MKSFPVLPTDIYQGYYEKNSELDDFVRNMKKESSNLPDMINIPKNLSFDIDRLPKSFFEFLNDSIEEVLLLEKILYDSYHISNIWINIHDKKINSHRYHVHQNSIFSGVYYYETVEKDTITFLDADENFNQYYDLLMTNHKTYKEKIYDKSISNGDILIFRSDVKHGVRPFTSQPNKHRTSISFNIDLKGIGNKDRKTYR